MRLTDFWERMEAQFGAGYADSFARDFVVAQLGSRTVHEALEAGVDPKEVWRAVIDAMDLPRTLR